MARLMLLVTLLLSSGCTRPTASIITEDSTVESVEKLGGTVTRNEELSGKPVIGVFLNDTPVTDAGLKELKLALPKCDISK